MITQAAVQAEAERLRLAAEAKEAETEANATTLRTDAEAKAVAILTLLIFIMGCSTVNNTTTKVMEGNSKTDHVVFQDKLDIDSFYKGEAGRWYHSLEDGTEIQIMDFLDEKNNLVFFVIATPPKPKFYTIEQQYDAKGQIRRRGKVLADLAVGVWEVYDEQGNKTLINEDEKFGKFTYNDVALFMHKKGHIDVNTGKNRERFVLSFDEAKNTWEVILKGTPDEDVVFTYILDGENGKVIKQDKSRWTRDD